MPAGGNRHPRVVETRTYLDRLWMARRVGQRVELWAMTSIRHVLVRFTESQGGTVLGVSLELEKSRSDLTQANFDAETGKIRLCGEITLDYVPVGSWPTLNSPA